MIEYIYIVKCPDREDEMFNFFTDARMQCDLLMSKKPSITQVEVERNDFGECTDSHDLGTVWSWEEVMKDTEDGYTDAEPTKSIFTKDDLKLMTDGKDPEFDNLDNSVDCEIDEIPEKKPIEEDLLSSYEYTRMTKEELYDRLVNKFEDVEIDVGDLGITDVPFYDGGRYSNSALVAMFEDDVFYVTMWHYSDDGEEIENGSYDFETDSFEELWDELMSYKPEALVECSERKPIPEGMTIEQLVEEMEENEDTVECVGCEELFPKKDCTFNKETGWLCDDCADSLVKCNWCDELFDKSECRYEVDLGWLCGRCEMAIKSRGETLTFREGNYWDFLDEDATKPVKKTWVCYYNGKDLGTVEAATEEEAIREMEIAWHGLNFNNEDVQVIPEDELEEEVKEIHDLGNEFDGGYPEIEEVSDSHLKICPECGKETFDIETGICVECGFN